MDHCTVAASEPSARFVAGRARAPRNGHLTRDDDVRGAGRDGHPAREHARAASRKVDRLEQAEHRSGFGAALRRSGSASCAEAAGGHDVN